MKRATALTALSLIVSASLPFAPGADSPDEKSAVRPEHRADFEVQGEYTGEVEGASGRTRYGFQIVALGKGRFMAAGYPGGLPGDGGKRAEARARGERREGVTRIPGFRGEVLQGDLEIRNGVLTITKGGKRLGELKKVERKSPTLGKKAPEGAVVLFDGKSAENFDPPRMSPEGWLECEHGSGLFSKRTFQSGTFHVEFRIPFEPEKRGQDRGNSGVYLQGRYEVQVLDSFGLEGRHNECGGIYSVKAPDLNMCFPPLSWQTYDIEFTAARYDEKGRKIQNARMTVYHNGVKVHDNVEVPHATTAAPRREGPEPGPLYLQNHGHPVRYRNIWVVERKD